MSEDVAEDRASILYPDDVPKAQEKAVPVLSKGETRAEILYPDDQPREDEAPSLRGWR